MKFFLFAAVILGLAVSCYDKGQEPVPDDIINFGEFKDFILDGVQGVLKKREIVCVFNDSQGNRFLREATFEEREQGVWIELLYGLAEGKYLFSYIQFASDNENDSDGVERIGVGRMVEVIKGKLLVTGSRSSEYGFGGSGTKDDPYQITCDSDLYKLQGFVNADGGEERFVGEYFVQTEDIDLHDYSYYVNAEYGWMPIGKSVTNSFQGYYDGNGKKVSGIYINRERQSVVGLFGALYNAVIKDLTIEGATVVGDGAVGALVGAVRGDGERMSVSLVSNCSVVGSTVKGSTGVGGVIGMTDAGTRVHIDSCTVSENTTVTSTHYAAGGILGAGVTYSSVAITGCANYAAVNGSLVNVGGIAGGADTLQVISCYNYGNVNIATEEETLGVGGIVGGAGVANFIGAHNYGNIKGYKGVGGIVGSTLVTSESDGSYATYNNVYIQSSHNQGKVDGVMMVGGLCGEAQLAAVHSYNKGKVAATGDYAGGIIGTTSVSAIHNSGNFGDVSGVGNVGGIAGKVQQGTYALNVNYGFVSGTRDNVGGIIGKTGNQSIIHYCGNYGKVKLEGEGSVGGIVGEIGDPREWSGWDIAEVVIGSAEILTAGIGGTVFCVAAAKGLETLMEVTHIVHSIADVVLLLANGVTIGYGGNLLHFPHLVDPAQEASVLRQIMEDEDKTNLQQFESLIGESGKTISFNPADINLLDSPLASLVEGRKSMVDFYMENSVNHTLFNERLNETMAERYEEVEHNKHHEEMVHTIIQGVCMGLTVVALIAGVAASGGTLAPAVMVGAAAVGMVGGANAISKAVRNYDANTLEISQCYNFGEIQADDSADAGGIVGKMADFSFVTDCLNGGKYDSEDYPIVESAGGKVTVENCLDLYGTDMRKLADVSNMDDYFSNNKILCYNKDLDDWVYIMVEYEGKTKKYGLDSVDDVLVPETLCKSSSYGGWDLATHKLWRIPQEGTMGSFPVPYISKMTFESSGGGH